MDRKPNRLAGESSPYLRQHAYNPVDWYPWSPEAFERARAEDRPIFLSIGYSTCHWCHVMARESFEDKEIAEMLNRAFVCVKVDREERPDIDAIYMEACQIMTGRGGWPLTIIMSPDGVPFFAATYIPKEGRLGMMGLRELIPLVEDLWKNRRSELTALGSKVLNAMRKADAHPQESNADESTLSRAYLELSGIFDWASGGFGRAPKFPLAQNLLFLLRYWHRTGEVKALEMVELTLREMRCGGIYDQLGYGFHRYSTDSSWGVPHFEKMLYDQALMSLAYLEALQATGNRDYAIVADEILGFVAEELISPEGAFCSALDAESDGIEGGYYLWTMDQLRDALGDDLKKALDAYILEPAGGSNGRSVLRISLEGELGEFKRSVEPIRRRLLEARSLRARPFRDEKVLADWNGLMIAAFSRGAQVLGEERWMRIASRAADFVLSSMHRDGMLLHSHKGSRVSILDDYAFLIFGLMELYQAGFDGRYLERAEILGEEMISHFLDPDGGFYYTMEEQGDHILRRKEVRDGAIPSGNAMATIDLLMLGKILGRPDLEEIASKSFRNISMDSLPAQVGLLIALDLALGPSYEIAIVGDADGTKAMLRALWAVYVPRKVVVAGDRSPEWASGLQPLDGKATAYVCRGYTCSLPTTDIRSMIELLGVRRVLRADQGKL
ncbi:MAG: thioredoxin domain-containing protein [Methanothrix sp.]|uniref:thioredoxin domain-containing protein n=1 Tax=Methanothrix sp. TaxID=90426 RepID=UPI0025F17A30|nr:thioredoxin domain-containing protein [Methanothrix sp.]MCQ8902480.1 thioredoxin domain-containing protein [Methanothrix sp.]